MESNNTCKKINKRTVAAVLIATVCFAIIALSAGIAGHTTYLKDCEARILNYATDFKATTPQTLTYFYKDGTKEIDLKKLLSVEDFYAKLNAKHRSFLFLQMSYEVLNSESESPCFYSNLQHSKITADF